jgi:hypothetical protein
VLPNTMSFIAEILKVFAYGAAHAPADYDSLTLDLGPRIRFQCLCHHAQQLIWKH